MALVTDARNATLEDLATLLKDQQAHKVDVVAPATAIRSEDGTLVIEGALTEMVPDPAQGLVEARTAGRFAPTSICDDGLSEKLGVHRAYLRRMRTERPDLLDANVNGWLHGLTREQTDDERASGERGAASAAIRPDGRVNLVDADPRKFLVRCFADPDGGPGIARAFLSDGFGFIDHLDVLGGTLEGIAQAGVDVKITRCRPLTMGMRWVETAIVPAGADFDTSEGEPRYAAALERWVWRPLYWLRNRWDGLRYGLDRDRRSF